MSLASAYAKALGERKLMVINGVICADPKSKVIQEFVSEFALERCLVEETESEIRVTLEGILQLQSKGAETDELYQEMEDGKSHCLSNIK